MLICSAANLSVAFPAFTLFEGLSFGVERGAHIGLVGVNGCGKTTLFRLISGQMQPDSGELSFQRGLRLCYMEQFLEADEQISLYEATAQVFAPLIAIERELERLNERLLHNSGDKLLNEQQALQERYAEGGGYTYRGRLRSALLGLGFSEDDLQLPVHALSGGQRSKALLAKMLLREAELLLLDEPTNHLDINAIEWLENYLAAYRGAFIVVSHDRYFLDRVTEQTWELKQGRLLTSNHNYSAHLLSMEKEDEAARRQYQNRLREIRRIEAVIEQQRRWNQARNYVTIASKQKQIERLKKELVKPRESDRALAFAFNSPLPGGNEVLEIREASKSFGGKKLFYGANMQIRKGERVFLLGPNGCGKTTLMKMITGAMPYDGGMVKLGVNIHLAYYDQIQSRRQTDKTVLAEFTDSYPRLTQSRIRTMLGSFLFSADDIEKTLPMLSGGEKARLELLKLMLTPANFLLLDEPSNHLDIASREAVERALLDYPGAMLVISHDRFLINKLADKIYYMHPDHLEECVGNYDDYLEKLSRAAGREAAPPPGGRDAAEPTGGGDYRRRKQEQAASRKREKRLQAAEQEVTQAEHAVAQLNQRLMEPEIAADYQRLMELNAQLQEAQMQLDAALAEWEAASAAVES
ncbi:MAG: ABC-F family ATP-binding cassette domain-containing protein [Bacillota bacterium]|nr:ABC-F family ATP-binding cassette domain-containing protein [Bacillota bacterium]